VTYVINALLRIQSEDRLFSHLINIRRLSPYAMERLNSHLSEDALETTNNFGGMKLTASRREDLRDPLIHIVTADHTDSIHKLHIQPRALRIVTKRRDGVLKLTINCREGLHDPLTPSRRHCITHRRYSGVIKIHTLCTNKAH
jgi:hypothetical protein